MNLTYYSIEYLWEFHVIELMWVLINIYLYYWHVLSKERSNLYFVLEKCCMLSFTPLSACRMYHHATVAVLLSRSWRVRKRAQQTIKKLLSSLGGSGLAHGLLKELCVVINKHKVQNDYWKIYIHLPREHVKLYLHTEITRPSFRDSSKSSSVCFVNIYYHCSCKKGRMSSSLAWLWLTACCKLADLTPGRPGVRVRRAEWAGPQLRPPSRPAGRTVYRLLISQSVERPCWSRAFGHGDPHSYSSSLHRWENELLCRLLVYRSYINSIHLDDRSLEFNNAATVDIASLNHSWHLIHSMCISCSRSSPWPLACSALLHEH